MLSANKILMNEHQDVERFLRVLDVAVGKLQQNEELPPSLWERAADFVQGFGVDCHQAKEEKYLLPLIELRGMPRQGPVGAVLHEHEAIACCAAALTAAVKEYTTTGGGTAKVIDCVHDFSSTVHRHISNEDRALLPIVDSIISDADRKQLLTQFRRIDGNRMSKKGRAAHYRLMLHDMERELGLTDRPM